MDARRITIKIDNGGNDNFNMHCSMSKQKSVIGHSIDEVDPMLNEEFNLRMEVVNDTVVTSHGKSPKRRQSVTVVERRSQSPIRSPMPPLPFPPKHRINTAWKKTPPIPKLTVCTEPGTVKLTCDDGMGVASYQLYAPLDGYELFACILDGGVDNAKWEKLTYILASAPNQNQRVPITCKLTKKARGIEYYFAVRGVDVHERCGPCAVVYARL
ncbi:unnamed protein product [Macrosiphum euphorbiae]|uniref:Activating transcription factor 7-interacting protein Fn3 domain-containing protein n=1 Tax=Macrosiphum euphorbiae TaxID=13131 RepID=A0AAV0WC41_9HEMI|nr:unnamed protein product [Macrosiphum euphorbiae]